ncbi:hypothetical protein MAP00_001369 [Monascus purpureus]|nr:hypothetical protein MAP00_001369 [Monascus purpureus]
MIKTVQILINSRFCLILFSPHILDKALCTVINVCNIITIDNPAQGTMEKYQVIQTFWPIRKQDRRRKKNKNKNNNWAVAAIYNGPQNKDLNPVTAKDHTPATRALYKTNKKTAS